MRLCEQGNAGLRDNTPGRIDEPDIGEPEDAGGLDGRGHRVGPVRMARPPEALHAVQEPDALALGHPGGRSAGVAVRQRRGRDEGRAEQEGNHERARAPKGQTHGDGRRVHGGWTHSGTPMTGEFR
jgi:hypothetical protein